MAALVVALAATVLARAEQPDPQELLREARMASTNKEASVRGQLRAGKLTTPFTLTVNFGKLHFAFEDPARVLEVRLNDDSSGVFDAKGRAMKKGMQEPVAEGVPVTAEDLSLGFLYWPDAQLMGKETVRTRAAWKIELRPGKRGSEFAVVRGGSTRRAEPCCVSRDSIGRENCYAGSRWCPASASTTSGCSSKCASRSSGRRADRARWRALISRFSARPGPEVRTLGFSGAGR